MVNNCSAFAQQTKLKTEGGRNFSKIIHNCDGNASDTRTYCLYTSVTVTRQNKSKMRHSILRAPKWIIPDFWYPFLNAVPFPYRQNCWCEWCSPASTRRPKSISSLCIVDPMWFSMYKSRCSPVLASFLQNLTKKTPTSQYCSTTHLKNHANYNGMWNECRKK